MSEKTITGNLGHVTAYGYAKGAGYTGTEQEFAEKMRDYASAAGYSEHAAASESAAAESESNARSYAQAARADAASAKESMEYARLFQGAPRMAKVAEDMTDTSLIYVYIGQPHEEIGYTTGNWYFYNGSAWVSGGVYNATAFNTDEQLIISGAAADAAAVGTALEEIDESLANYASALTEIPVSVVSGGIGSTGASSESDTRIRSQTAVPLQAGDVFVCDAPYAIRVVIYRNYSVTSGNFISFLNDFKTGAVAVPDEYAGQYAAVLIEKTGQETVDISADLASIYKHVRLYRAASTATEDKIHFAERQLFTEPLAGGPLELVSGELVPESGANRGADGRAVRTGFIPVPSEDLLCTFSAAGYAWTCWSYSGTTVGGATHSNTGGTYVSGESPISVSYAAGDATIRLGFRRKDNAVLTTDLDDPTSDWSIIQSAIKILTHEEISEDLEERLTALKDRIDELEQPSLNQIDLRGLTSTAAVTVTQNGDGSATFSAKASGSYVYLRIPGLSLKPQTKYCLRMKVSAVSAADANGAETTPVIGLRFYGIAGSRNGLSIGITPVSAPGDYVGMVYTTGYENGLELLLSGSQVAAGTVTISELMLAESEVCLPYVPYGETGNDNNAKAYADGFAAASKTWGLANAMANANQFIQASFTPLRKLPSQFGDFPAGTDVMGVPYSSARFYDKLVGVHVSLHTFLSAMQNPRSVLYTRQLVTSNSKTFYGCVCSAYTNHIYGIETNYTTAAYAEYDGLRKKPLTALQPGDVLLNDKHIMFVTDVSRDRYGRILSINTAQAGEPKVRADSALQWSQVEALTETGYAAYEYRDLEGVEYTPSEHVKGYPDEELPAYVWPDIMSEFGDRAVFMKGESTVINVINAEGYDSIAIRRDGVLIETRDKLRDFTLDNLTGGAYEIEMTGQGKSSTTSFFVVDAECSYDEETHVVTWNTSNATLSALYTYGWEWESINAIRNNVVELSAEELGSRSGSRDLSAYIDTTIGDHSFQCPWAKVGFKTPYGVATWRSKELLQWVSYEGYADPGDPSKGASWSSLKKMVQDGAVQEMHPVGSQFFDIWKRDAEESYAAPWDVRHYDEDGNAYLQWHYVTPDGIPFDEPEAIFYADENGLAAGTYHIPIGSAYGKGWIAGQAIQFTLTEAMAEGDQFVISLRASYNNNPTAGRTWNVYAKGDTVSKQHGTTSNGTGGTSLGTIGATSAQRPEGLLNAISRAVYGSGRWSQSVARQWLNSEAAAGGWWTPQNAWDRPPAVAATLNGFLWGCSEDFLSILEPVEVVTALNTAEGYADTTETTLDRIFLPSLQEMHISPQLANAEGEDWEYYIELAAEAGVSGRFGTGTSNVYPELISYRVDAHTSPASVSVRSTYRGSAGNAWTVDSTGHASTYGANYTFMGRPAIKILAKKEG